VVALILTLALPAADPAPAFTVRAVAVFAVENKMPAGPPGKTARVELNGLWYDRRPDGSLDYCRECNGGRLPVGKVVTPEEHAAIVRAGVVPAPGVAAPRPFRRQPGGYDPDHDCDRCGASQFVVSGSAPGGHTHTCGRCGNVWWH
jgi:hypothetical protein